MLRPNITNKQITISVAGNTLHKCTSQRDRMGFLHWILDKNSEVMDSVKGQQVKLYTKKGSYA